MISHLLLTLRLCVRFKRLVTDPTMELPNSGVAFLDSGKDRPAGHVAVDDDRAQGRMDWGDDDRPGPNPIAFQHIARGGIGLLPVGRPIAAGISTSGRPSTCKVTGSRWSR